ncbi:MAG: Rrf2 family transcriptional regulator [Gemmataceae bacterium]
MRLSLFTDYALRTLLYLASHARRATVREVADFYGISADHVAKAVNLLARLGYLRSVRGIGGGIELGRAPETIRLGELIVALEGNMHLLECVGCSGVCAIESFCKLKGVLARAEQVQREYLDSVTLRDLTPAVADMTRRPLPVTE